jgi:hypothetical protein
MGFHEMVSCNLALVQQNKRFERGEGVEPLLGNFASNLDVAEFSVCNTSDRKKPLRSQRLFLLVLLNQ